MFTNGSGHALIYRMSFKYKGSTGSLSSWSKQEPPVSAGGGAGHSWLTTALSSEALTIPVQETCHVLQTVPMCFRSAVLASEAD